MVPHARDGLRTDIAAATVLFAVALLSFAPAAFAQSVPIAAAPAGASPLGALQPFVPLGAPQTSATSSEVTTTSIQAALRPYGDPGGIRAFLKSKGIEYSFTYVGETLGNPTGGYRQSAIYEGRLDGELNVDLDKLAGLKGTALHTNFYQIHGRGLSIHNLLDLFTTSGIEAYPDTKLYEAWLGQKLLDDKLELRFGQLAIDAEYLVSQTASVFVNSSYGFPAIYANNLPSGGGSYPFAAPGVEVHLKASDRLTVSAVVYDGDPAATDVPVLASVPPNRRDAGGIAFRLRDPPLFLTEAAYSYNHEKDAKGLSGVVKVGYLHHFDRFPDYDAPPGARTVMGNDGAYLILDQSIFREEGSDQGASIFVRAMGASPGRNLIDAYVDGGIAYQGLFPGRPKDTIGLSGAYAHISSSVTRQDDLSGAAPLIRDYQALIEATYQYLVLDGLTLQPDFQYVFHPGANGVADRNGNPLRDAAVFGLRATIIY